ncbi:MULTISPECIES: ABC transporter ATP-binding protein [unclassified Cupriavidus]|uniref:ABC transporter ATP-binding protein n=1 Tax=unclassified Cupriavidus TaxID=2640874 RepID=UPI001C005B9E|nr:MULTISPECIES: ABC transporter ATP-binding protein [unclassified Cupriavidus]MCA3185353.1 ABC transporter ATP-binding protein [Cupriavidus sp.]MCA3190716.1 ABC transporter ATP-binding protein [Cupriavidus sp.]MCA3199197.1 ABC transporter ATP-binding protein [Cupriavidus sp.]MCA3205134.1 ABC transporter ATP-binding protein [Cupriavidus sp.]MCA3208022.1 ABC transporter ATP-binding protein [Cupriavidus sp.]
MHEPTPIRLRQCAKTFADGTLALQPLDLDIGAGETVVLLGPSGCGKTTTLRIIAGLEAPDPGGEVWFGDTRVTDQPIEQRGVGMVFQNYALFPNMTVAENIGYGLRVRRERRLDSAARRRRVDEMLAMMHLEPFADRRIDQLSGGQRQRVALARAIAVQPRVLLLDEPLTALDAKLRDALRADINQLLRSLHITAVYVTHDQAEAMALGDRIIVMDKGRIAQTGTPQDIYRAPANAFVADFIGTMNHLPGTAEAGRWRVPGGTVPMGPPDDAPITSTARLMFRPEDVALVHADDAHVEGTVVTALFLGNHTRLLVDVGAAAPLIVDTARRDAWAAGTRVGLRIDTQHLITLCQAA